MKMIRLGGVLRLESAAACSDWAANGSATPNFNKSRRVVVFINACLSVDT